MFLGVVVLVWVLGWLKVDVFMGVFEMICVVIVVVYF